MKTNRLRARGRNSRRISLLKLVPVVLGVAILLILGHTALGAPFARKVPFTQPDGTKITLWGEGDEF